MEPFCISESTHMWHTNFQIEPVVVWHHFQWPWWEFQQPVKVWMSVTVMPIFEHCAFLRYTNSCWTTSFSKALLQLWEREKEKNKTLRLHKASSLCTNPDSATIVGRTWISLYTWLCNNSLIHRISSLVVSSAHLASPLHFLPLALAPSVTGVCQC